MRVHLEHRSTSCVLYIPRDVAIKKGLTVSPFPGNAWIMVNYDDVIHLSLFEIISVNVSTIFIYIYIYVIVLTDNYLEPHFFPICSPPHLEP